MASNPIPLPGFGRCPPSGSKQIALPSLPDAPEDPSDGLFEAGPSSKEKQAPGLHDVFHAAVRSPPSLTIKNKALAVMQVPCFVSALLHRRRASWEFIQIRTTRKAGGSDSPNTFPSQHIGRTGAILRYRTIYARPFAGGWYHASPVYRTSVLQGH